MDIPTASINFTGQFIMEDETRGTLVTVATAATAPWQLWLLCVSGDRWTNKQRDGHCHHTKPPCTSCWWGLQNNLYQFYRNKFPLYACMRDLSPHLYADDTQVYGSCRPSMTAQLLDRIKYSRSDVCRNAWLTLPPGCAPIGCNWTLLKRKSFGAHRLGVNTRFHKVRW